MADREKVIKGLEICSTGHCEISCPFHNVPQCTMAILSDALALLKQEAKQVIGIADSIEGIEVGYCPSCDKAIVNKKIDETKFCKFCGQAVKWE